MNRSACEPVGRHVAAGVDHLLRSPVMSAILCPICGGATHEIRAKLLCRTCGAILETCCEGGPMAGGCPPEQPHDASRPVQPERADDSRRG